MTMRARDGETGFQQEWEVYFNGTAETIPTGAPICLDTVSLNGVYVAKPVTGQTGFFVGVADEDAAPGTYFRVQTKGWRPTGALVIGSIPIAIGDILAPDPTNWQFVREGAGDGKSGYVIAAEICTDVTAVLKKVYIRG